MRNGYLNRLLIVGYPALVFLIALASAGLSASQQQKAIQAKGIQTVDTGACSVDGPLPLFIAACKDESRRGS